MRNLRRGAADWEIYTKGEPEKRTREPDDAEEGDYELIAYKERISAGGAVADHAVEGDTLANRGQRYNVKEKDFGCCHYFY